MSTRSLLALIIASVGCSSTLPDDVAAEFQDGRFGCDNALLSVSGGNGGWGVQVFLDAPLDGLPEPSDGHQIDYDFADDSVRAAGSLIRGKNVTAGFCDDVAPPNGTRKIRQTWNLTGGLGTLTVWSARQGEFDTEAQIDFEVSDAVFTMEGSDDEPVSVELLRWTDVSVGWLPG